MIKLLRVNGFKRFRSVEVPFRPLTVLAGLNGSGKSSLIQMLLLMKGAAREKAEILELNGCFGLNLGGAESLRSWEGGEIISAQLEDDDGRLAKWTFGVPDGNRPYLEVRECPPEPPLPFDSRKRTFSYLNAERLGPRQILPEAALPPDELEIGVQGEYAAQIINELGNKALAYAERKHPESGEADASLLKYELERWLSEISRPIEIDALSHGGCAVASLRFRSPGSEWVSAPNMGFGVTYSLPVVLAGLIALPGGLLVVENPEAHLHPAGQSRMGQFLAWIASRGVQVVVETHSDHVLNGIRAAIAVRRYLRAGDAIVNYLDAAEDDSLIVFNIEFRDSGSLTEWPRGFFDQYRIDVSSLGRVRRATD